MAVGDSVISISGIPSQQERLDKQRVTARDSDGFPFRLSRRKGQLVGDLVSREVWFVFLVVSSHVQRREEVRKLFYKYFQQLPSLVLSFGHSGCEVENQFDLFSGVIRKDVSCICITISRRQSREKLPHSWVRESKEGSGACLLARIGLVCK